MKTLTVSPPVWAVADKLFRTVGRLIKPVTGLAGLAMSGWIGVSCRFNPSRFLPAELLLLLSSPATMLTCFRAPEMQNNRKILKSVRSLSCQSVCLYCLDCQNHSMVIMVKGREGKTHLRRCRPYLNSDCTPHPPDLVLGQFGTKDNLAPRTIWHRHEKRTIWHRNGKGTIWHHNENIARIANAVQCHN